MCVCEPARLDDVLAVCARWEVHGTAIGEVTDTGAMRIFRGDELVGDMPVAALVDDCPVYELAPQRPAAPLYDPPAATLARGGSVHEALLALLASPNLASRRPLFEQYDWIVQSRTVRRPEEADAAVLALPDGGAPRRVHRRQRPPRGRRPLPGHDRGDARVRGEPRLRGRRAARRDQQPQLRQPREAAHRLAAHRGGPRPGRRLPGPRRAGHRRQRLALQRVGATGGPIYPTPVIGMVGRLPDARRAGPPRVRARGRRDRARRAGTRRRRWPAASWPSCGASRCPTACPRSTSRRRARCSRRSATRCAPAR